MYKHNIDATEKPPLYYIIVKYVSWFVHCPYVVCRNKRIEFCFVCIASVYLLFTLFYLLAQKIQFLSTILVILHSIQF